MQHPVVAPARGRRPCARDVAPGRPGGRRRGAGRDRRPRTTQVTLTTSTRATSCGRCGRRWPSSAPGTARPTSSSRPERRTHRRAVGRGRQGRLPRRQPARGVRRRGRRHRRAVDRPRGARRGRLPAADDGRLPGDLRHRDRPLRHRRAEAAVAARARRRHDDHGVRASPSPTPAPTPTRSPPWPAGTATTGCCPAARSASAASTRPTRCSSSASWRTPARARCGPALFVVPTDAAGADRAPDPDGDHQPGEPVPAVPRRRPAARRRAGRRPGPGHRAAVRRPQPRAGHGGRLLAGGRPAAPCARRPSYAASAQVWGTPIGAHQGLAHPLAACQIEIECARLMTQKAAWLYRRRAGRRNRRQHRQVRRGRGGGARRRPGDPDPRRQRPLPGVRRRRAAGHVPRRAGSPRSAAR